MVSIVGCERSQMLDTRLNGILVTSLMGQPLTTTSPHLVSTNSMQRQRLHEKPCQVGLPFPEIRSLDKPN